jgi:uncharacterized protein YpmS
VGNVFTVRSDFSGGWATLRLDRAAMKKWIKRIMLAVALMLSVTALMLAGGFALIRRTPDFYHRSLLSPAQRAAAASRAETKLTAMENMVVDSHGSEIRAINRATTVPQAGARTFTFTEDELNSLFNKWSDLHDWREVYQRFIDDPVIILQPGKIILAGKLRFKDLDTVVSVHFQPRITPDGKLDVNMVSILGGRLPLPQQLMEPMRDHMDRYLADRLPNWRAKANIEANGATNEDAMKVALGKLALEAANHEPGEPVVFFPLMSDRLISVPVKLVGIAIDKNALTLTVVPMNAGERGELLGRIKQPSEVEAGK